MAAQQKRLLTAEKSKLGKADLTTTLRKDAAWSTLPLEARQHLYTLLPTPNTDAGEPPHDQEINPLTVDWLRPHIEEALRTWQEDLANGLETKKWRTEALEAGVDRLEGQYDQFKDAEREEFWGQEGQDENVTPKQERNGLRDGVREPEVPDSQDGEEEGKDGLGSR